MHYDLKLENNKQIKNIYEIYGLEQNPFPKQGIFPVEDLYEKEYARILIGNQKVVKRIDDLIKRFGLGENPPLIAIVGDYGFGKTHALKHIYYRILEEVPNGIPIFIKGPDTPSMLRIYNQAIESIRKIFGEEFLIKIAKNVEKNEKLFEIRRVYPDYAKALQLLARGQNEMIMWLIGEKFPVETLKKNHLYSNITEDRAKDALLSLVRAIYYGINRRVALLIDELEIVFGWDDEVVLRRFYDQLRSLIDMTQREALYVLSCPPTVILGKKAFEKLHPALFQRLFNAVIELERLDIDSTKRLFIEYLKLFRKSKIGELYDPLHPFTEDAIQIIFEKALGVPRRILLFARYVLEQAALNHAHKITPKLVRKYLEEKPKEPEKEEKDEIKLVEEAIKESEAEKEAEKIAKTENLSGIEKMILKELKTSPNRSLTITDIRKALGLTKELALSSCRKMQQKGLVLMKRRGGGYRVYLKV